MNLHPAEIARTVAPSARAALVRDRAGWHGGKDLMAPENISPLTLPPYAPEPNSVENVRQDLRANKFAITVFDGYADIGGKCSAAWLFFANDADAMTSITSRKWATANLWGRWYEVNQASPFIDTPV